MIRDPLIRGEIIAVASPAYLSLRDGPLTPEQISTENLIHLASVDLGWVEHDWPQWFEATGVSAPTGFVGLKVNLLHIAIETCVAGGASH